MNEIARSTLKGNFSAGAQPTAQQFGELIDAFAHLNEDNDNDLKLKGAIMVGNLKGASSKAGMIQWDSATSKFQACFTDGAAFVNFGGSTIGNPLDVGQARIETPAAGPASGFAVFAHSGFANGTDYALAQTAGGTTIINAGVGSAINFNNAGTIQMKLQNGMLTIGPTPPNLANATTLLKVFGRIEANETAIVDTSDIRIKKDIQAYQGGLEEINKINVVRFKYNGKGGFTDDRERVGIIAQEMEQILPEAIGTAKVKLNNDDDFETEILTFDKAHLFYKMVSAIKELTEKVNKLEQSQNVKLNGKQNNHIKTNA